MPWRSKACDIEENAASNTKPGLPIKVMCLNMIYQYICIYIYMYIYCVILWLWLWFKIIVNLPIRKMINYSCISSCFQNGNQTLSHNHISKTMVYIYIYTFILYMLCVLAFAPRMFAHGWIPKASQDELAPNGRTSGASSSSSPSGTSEEMCSSRMEEGNLCLKIRLLEKHSYSFICSHIHS